MTYLDVGTPSTDPGPDKGRRKDKTPSTRLNRYWKEIEAYNKATSDWREQGEKIVKLYLDQHRTNASPRRFAMLWGNVETLEARGVRQGAERVVLAALQRPGADRARRRGTA